MAKKKAQRISINAMDEIMKRYENTDTVQWNGLDVTITTTLPLEEMIAFADNVVKSCFDKTSDAYMPEIKDFAIRCNVMERYANFTLPSKVERKYDVVMRSGAFEMIINHVNAAQFNDLMRAIDMKLQNIAEANTQMVFRKFDDVVTSFEGLQNKVSSMFEGVDSADIGKLVNAIAENGVSEEKVVKAYMEQKQQAE